MFETSVNYRHKIRLQQQIMLEFMLFKQNIINTESSKLTPHSLFLTYVDCQFTNNVVWIQKCRKCEDENFVEILNTYNQEHMMEHILEIYFKIPWITCGTQAKG
jgi:malonyl CoA-acyl carrier protein transacylase